MNNMGRSRYICTECGQEHNDWPAIGWPSPAHYDFLSDEDKASKATLSSDFCSIDHETQIDRFIRCCLDQVVIDNEEPLQYGVWVSLSEQSYNDYRKHFNDGSYEAKYFGWLCTNIPEYGESLTIPLDVVVRSNGQRPIVIPHQTHDHALVRDYYTGITLEEAVKRIHVAISESDSNSI